MTDLLDRTRALVYEELAGEPRPRGLTPDELAAAEQAVFDRRRPDDPMPVPFRLAYLRFAPDSAETKRLNESLDEQMRALQSKRGNRDLGDDHYRQVAAIYAAAVQAGQPPTQAVARWLAGDASDDPDFVAKTKSQAAKQVARARDRGFLPKTTRGRAGRLTEEP